MRRGLLKSEEMERELEGIHRDHLYFDHDYGFEFLYNKIIL